MLSRRQFVRTVPTLGVFTVVSAELDAQPQPAVAAWPAPRPNPAWRDESFPSQHPHLAREIVGVAHRDLARVKELVGAHPSLAKASWDWGFGDWETALGSASHVGNRPIAEFLIEQGAPPTIFSAAMLGQLDVVRAYAAAMPNIHLLRGPHGIPLAAHARAGGAPAEPVLQFLATLGAPAPAVPVVPLSDSDRTALEGRYTFGPWTSRCVHREKSGQFVGDSARRRRAARADARRRPAISPRWRARRAREVRSCAVGNEHFGARSGPCGDRKKGRVKAGFVTGQGCHFSKVRRFAGVFSNLGLAADSHTVRA